ncbi:MAG: phosphoribosylanthranilate isomerase [Thermoguttaceae bacterium]|jgi:phosphoribosylanthranilate isomerase
MFRIKICGITDPGDARTAIQAGADAVGLNFYPASPRFITPAGARQICRVLPAEIVKVGVFVNAEAKDVCQTCDEIPLDLIQLHGDETPKYIARLGNRPVMRAFRLGPEGLQPVFAYLEECRQLGCVPKLVLLDALCQGVYGGTGKNADWSICAQYPGREGVPPLILAGGLTESNVGRAIMQVRPAGVDAAGGVESSPGRKDPAALIAFVQAAREAFAAF